MKEVKATAMLICKGNYGYEFQCLTRKKKKKLLNITKKDRLYILRPPPPPPQKKDRFNLMKPPEVSKRLALKQVEE